MEKNKIMAKIIINDFINYVPKYSTVKIYSVPEEYSSDNIYIADWNMGTIEPYPASDSRRTHLLATISKNEQGEYVLGEKVDYVNIRVEN